VAVPPKLVTDTAPVVAPGITIATKVVPLLETVMAATPPMLGAVGLLRLVPVMVTKVPMGPDVGLKEVMVGAGVAVFIPKAKSEKAVIPVRVMAFKFDTALAVPSEPAPHAPPEVRLAKNTPDVVSAAPLALVNPVASKVALYVPPAPLSLSTLQNPVGDTELKAMLLFPALAVIGKLVVLGTELLNITRITPPVVWAVVKFICAKRAVVAVPTGNH